MIGLRGVYKDIALRVMIRFREFENASFADIFRVYISGSSASGKTYFARQLLESGHFKCHSIYYYHPDFHETAPVDWQSTISNQVFYQAGLPSLEELLEIPENSCLVFDDLFSQCCESKDIDYLFRVLSSKRKLNLIIMTQRYFAESKGRIGLSIRNSCNYHVLMNNADARTNINVAHAMQLKPEITRATEENKDKLYPYIFVDKTNQARVNNLQVYTNIFEKYREVICGSMKFYLLSESDFRSHFCKQSSNTAKPREHKEIKRQISSDASESNTSDEENTDSSGSYESVSSTEMKIERAVKRALRKR